MYKGRSKYPRILFSTHFPVDILFDTLKMAKPCLVEQQVSEKSSFLHRASLSNGKEQSTSLVPFTYFIDYLVKSAKCLYLENLKKEVLLPQVCLRIEG